MASDLKTLVKAADIMRKASMSDRSMAPVWKPSRKYTGVDQAIKEEKDKLKHSLLKLVLADLTSKKDDVVKQLLEVHDVNVKSTTRQLELIQGGRNIVKDRILTEAASRIKLADDFNTLVESSLKGEYKGALTDDQVQSNADYYKSYDTSYTFPVYIVTELTKQDGGTKPPRFTNEMYRDALKTVRANRTVK
jgi:hypothetical protein